MIDDVYTHDDLYLFQATPGWKLLSASDQSLFEAYLRRSESWSLQQFLVVIDTEIDITALNPTHLIPNVTTNTHATIAPLNVKNQVPVVIPPSGGELQLLRKKWNKEWKRKQTEGEQQKPEGSRPVTLSKAEIQTVTQMALKRSREVSGHGRDPHGSYASSSSPATAARDKARSEKKAVEVALQSALARKKKGGSG